MLTQKQVIDKFKEILNLDEVNYSDSFNFDIENTLGISNDGVFNPKFYESFSNYTEIESWIDLVKSKLVILEDFDEPENIIGDFIGHRIRNFEKSN
jgi:hypothetical protein